MRSYSWLHEATKFALRDQLDPQVRIRLGQLGGGLHTPRAGWYLASGRAPIAGLVHGVVYALLVLYCVAALRLALRIDERWRRPAMAVIVFG